MSPEAHTFSIKAVFNPSVPRCKRSPSLLLISGMSLPSAFSLKMPWLACGAGLGCSLPPPCPEGLLSIRVPQAHHVGLTQCSFSCSSTSLSGNLKLTFLSWLLLHIVLKLLVWKVSWLDIVDRGPQAVSLAEQNTCGLHGGDFSSRSSNSAFQFIRQKQNDCFSPVASLKEGEAGQRYMNPLLQCFQW